MAISECILDCCKCNARNYSIFKILSSKMFSRNRNNSLKRQCFGKNISVPLKHALKSDALGGCLVRLIDAPALLTVLISHIRS